MHFSGVFFLLVLLVLTACEEPGSYSALTETDREQLRDAAGEVARYSALHPEDSLRPPRPSVELIDNVEEICESHPEAWAYFYGCVSDTVAALQPPDPSCQEPDFETYSQDEIENR